MPKTYKINTPTEDKATSSDPVWIVCAGGIFTKQISTMLGVSNIKPTSVINSCLSISN